MGQKVSPIGFRTGITIGWKSRWFAPKSNYGEFLVEDAQVRRFIDGRLNRQPPYAAISCIEIERTREEVRVILKTARPGLVIGPRGAEVDRLRGALEDLTNRRVSIDIVEIRTPDLDAQLVAEGIAEQLKRRGSFRRVMKMRAEAAMQAGAKGVKIIISGRLGGAEMSRSETQIMGSIPLHTLEADVDYGFTPSHTTYGSIGVKVWIYRGMFSEISEEEERVAAAGTMTRARRRRERALSQRSGPDRPRRKGRAGPAVEVEAKKSDEAPSPAPAAEQTVVSQEADTPAPAELPPDSAAKAPADQKDSEQGTADK